MAHVYARRGSGLHLGYTLLECMSELAEVAAQDLRNEGRWSHVVENDYRWYTTVLYNMVY